MEESMRFAPLLLVVLLAFLVPILLSRFQRLGIPIVVGEIIVGIIVGRSGFGWVAHQDPLLDLLSEFGFVFLMFLSGMEIDFTMIGFPKTEGEAEGLSPVTGPLPLAGIVFLTTLILSTGFGFGFRQFGFVQDPWMLALILSTTSLGVVVPVLKERGLSSGRYGQSLLVSALVADFITMILITILVAVLSHGLTLDILLIGVLFLAFFAFYRFGKAFFTRFPSVRLVIEELSHATAQIKMRAAFTVMLAFVALSEALGTEVILGAFLAGAVIALLKKQEDMEMSHQLEAVGFGFFIPIFFIMVGVDLNLSALFSSNSALILMPLLLIAAILVKLLPALWYRLSFNWRETLGAGTLLSARLSLIIAASAIGLRLNIISESVNAAIILVAVFSVIGAPLLFNRLVPKATQEGKRALVVVGAGPLGLQVAEQLHNHGEDIVIFDIHPDRIEHAKSLGFDAHLAPMYKFDPTADAYLEHAKGLVCVYNDTENSLKVCGFVHTAYGIENIVARVNTPADVPKFEALGVKTMNPAMDQATLLALLVRNPSFYELLTRADDDKEVREITVANSVIVDRQIKDLGLPEDIVVLAVRREGELMVPHGRTKLKIGDKVTIAGRKPYVEKMIHLFR